MASEASLPRTAEQASDRGLHDEVIRYLADARLRRQSPAVPITAAEAEKANRFARFLARRYYRDRVVRSFRYARQLTSQTGRSPEEIIETPAFEHVLAECVLASAETARRVAELAMQHFNASPSPGPWWEDLVEYESAFFLQMATAERAAPGPYPRPGASATIRRFRWRLPEVLARLRANEAIADNLRGPATLLFSRTREGRVYVAEIDARAAAVFEAANGLRGVSEIADAVRTPLQDAAAILSSLAEIGALELAG